MHVLECLEPPLRRFVIDLQIFAETPDRQGRSDLVRQELDEVFDQADVADVLEIPKILAHHARETVALPDAVLDRVLREERFGESTEFQQGVEIGSSRWVVQFSE